MAAALSVPQHCARRITSYYKQNIRIDGGFSCFKRSSLCTVWFILYTHLSISTVQHMYLLYPPRLIWNCTLFIVYCTVYIVPLPQYKVQYRTCQRLICPLVLVLYIVYCTVYIVPLPQYKAQYRTCSCFILPICSGTVHRTQCTVRYILYAYLSIKYSTGHVLV